MKIVEDIDLLNPSLFKRQRDLKLAWKEVRSAVTATDWPHGSGHFTIYPESGKKRGMGNGVKPIKRPCMVHLRSLYWKTERFPPIKGGVLTPGDLDALKDTKSGYVAFEWETGNISSSHRAINKLLLTLQIGGLLGGFLVVPSDNLKVYLTDRIGNVGELRPYFPLWKSITGATGGLKIVVVEHDSTSRNIAPIKRQNPY